MQRDQLEAILSDNNYLKGGTKEACIKIKETLNNCVNPGNQLHPLLSCVGIEEFVDAVEVLVASAYQKEDEIPKTWHCNMVCVLNKGKVCPGMHSVKKDSDQLCPFFKA